MSIALAQQDKSGKFTGALDESLVQKVRMGGIQKNELLALARKKTSSRASKMSFKANELLVSHLWQLLSPMHLKEWPSVA
jgi:hypothetical protein